MTFRTCPSTGDRVSLLGYGCMRWPLLESPAADGNPIDQEAGQRAGRLCHRPRGQLFRHGPRLHTGLFRKIDGYRPQTPSAREGVHRHEDVQSPYGRAGNVSRSDIQGFGGDTGGRFATCKRIIWITICCTLWAATRASRRSTNVFIDCGVLDFLLREREAGRIRNLGWSFHGDQKVFDHLLAMHDKAVKRGGISSRSR